MGAGAGVGGNGEIVAVLQLLKCKIIEYRMSLGTGTVRYGIYRDFAYVNVFPRDTHKTNGKA